MKIATARKKTSQHWRTSEITWDAFLDKLRTPLRTAETVREYRAMSKDERDAAKEAAGGFVAGALSSGRRKTEFVTERSMLTLDADSAHPQAWESVTMLLEYRMCCYTTHSHTEAKPRLRWIIPTSRPMTPDEYPAVARKVATWLDIETMDPTTYEVARLMFWATCPKDGAYSFHEQDGPLLNPDEVLASYGPGEAWRDTTLWPIAKSEAEVRQKLIAKAGEPTEKPGIVGLFCRTYDVPAAIAEFIPEVYTPTAQEDRYTYAKGSTAGGAIIYNDGAFLYSNHATDPAGGRSVNAFDLVRIHKFGEMDGGLGEDDATPTQRPSYKAMVEWMDNLEAVTEQKLREGNEQFDADFGDMAEATDENTAERVPPFVIKGARGQLKVDATRLAEYVRRNLHYRLVRDTATEAQRVFVYDRGVYQQCAPEMFQGKIKEFIRDYSKPLVSMPPVMEAYHQLMTDTNYEKQTSLDADKDLINFRNGVLRLSDMTLLPHSPDILSTIQVPCNWIDKEPETPVFDAYMHTLTSGNDGVKQLLLEFMGVALSNVPGCKMKKALFLFESGNTGKSQLRILLTRLLGDRLCSSADLADLEARFGTSNLYGKRLVGSPDMRYATVRELRVFKTVSAGDPIMVEFKGQPAFSYTYQGVLWFCANELPCFGGDNGPWVYERIVPVRCSNVVPEEERDALLVDRMYAERGGIVYQAVQALKRVIRNGYRYDIPESVLTERQRYQVENDSALSFFDECMRHTMPGEKLNPFCTTGRVYRVYQAWCRQNTRNGYAKSQTDFRKALAMHLKLSTDDLIVRQKGQSYYRGITLRREAKTEYADDYDCFVDMETTETA